MKRNFNVVVNTYDGRPYFNKVLQYDEKTGLPVLEVLAGGVKIHSFDRFTPKTLRDFALEALAHRWKGEESMGPKESGERIKLLDKLTFTTDGTVEITAAEGAVILDAMKCQGVDHLVVARMQGLLDTDPPTQPAEHAIATQQGLKGPP